MPFKYSKPLVVTPSYARRAAVILFALAAVSARAAVSPWQAADAEAQTIPEADRWVRPNRFRAYRLDAAALRLQLDRAPREFTPAAVQAPAEVSLPMPDGTLARFSILESPIMAPELAAKYPEIKTWCGQGIDDTSASIRFDLTPSGFHAQILSPNGAAYIEPARRGDSVLHMVYHKHELPRDRSGFTCLTPDDGLVLFQPAAGIIRSGASLRTYRLAVSATGEYTQFHGGTVAQGLAAIVTAINRVDGIYETELAIRLVLVANNDLLVFTNPSTDPFSNANPTALLTQNQSITDQRIGSANYDIGHVFSTGGGGLSSVAIVCLDGSKARSETGLPMPTGDAYYVDFVAHEMGHEFGALHSYNGIGGNCGGQRDASTAYEPGSGSTIMGYAGICAADDLQPHSDPYFHFISIEEIQFYTTVGFGSDCPVITATGNSAPSVEAGANYVIPARTPFALTAFGTDPNGQPITYCWEEHDLGPAVSLGTADNGSSPLFRSFPPTVSPVRTFPRLSDLLNNSFTAGEALPTTSRTMNFRVTARDNRVGGGGVTTDDMAVTVVGTAGPFRVTAPNTPVVWSGFRTVTWDVAGTASSPINAASVTILLSTNGGVTYPAVLAATTPNDGSESVLLPNISTSQARIRVQAAGNIFFDISDSNFSITTYVPAPAVGLDNSTLLVEDCTPSNGAVDPGETVTVNIALRNVGTADTSNIVATLTAGGGVVPLSGPQSYGVLTFGGAAVARPFTFQCTAPCGGSVAAALQIQNGLSTLPAVTNSFVTGAFVPVTNSFANTSSISIPSRNAATPYPSTLTVSGLGTITKVTATLSNFSHTFTDDVDALLVGPGGQTVLLMSDVGGSSSSANLTLTFDDSAANFLPDEAALSTGTWKPTNIGVDETFSSPAPAQPYGSALSVFNGLNPNGTWRLYVWDDSLRDSGSIANGWRLTLVTQSGPFCCSNQALPLLTIADTVVVEGNSGRTDAVFPLELSRPSQQPVTVTFATANGSAIGGLDFAPTNGTAQFGVGQTNQTLRVAVLGDTLFEGNESFSVLLSAPVNATLARTTATAVILDDEVRLALSTVLNAHAQLRFNSVTGLTYRVERTTTLPNTNAWIALPGATMLPGTGSLIEVLDTNALANPQRFYRARVVAP
jgi:subtilisin-like proprotein convertase family protein